MKPDLSAAEERMRAVKEPWGVLQLPAPKMMRVQAEVRKPVFRNFCKISFLHPEQPHKTYKTSVPW
jgi:hypothetical protein